MRRRRLLIGGTAGFIGLSGCTDVFGGDTGPDSGASETDDDAENDGDPGLTVRSASVSVNRPPLDDSVLVGEPMTVRATVGNTGRRVATEMVRLFVGSDEYASKEVTLDAGEMTDLSFETEVEEPGTADVAVNDLHVESITVTEPLEHDRRIGAHYYAWYWGEDGYGGYQTGSDHPDGWLSETPGEPILGAYDTHDPAIVNQHIKWSLEHGINWWIVNNGAPDGRIDRTIREGLFEAELADQMAFTVLLGFDPGRKNDAGFYDLDDPELRERLVERFVHWADTKVDHASYLYVDDRPTVYFWDSNVYVGDVAGAFEEAMAAIDVDPYVIGGPNYFWQPSRQTVVPTVYDAVKDYHSISTDIEYMERFRERTVVNQRRWSAAADELGVSFFPTVTPGYDNSAQSREPPDVPPIERDPEAFAAECAAVRGLADLDTIVITSFNEWPEHTAIEPSEEEGTAYLEVVAEELARADWNTPELDYRPLEIEFDATRTVDGRELAFRAREFTVHTGSGSITEDVGSRAERFVYLDGVYGPERDEVTARWFGGESGETRLLVTAESTIRRVSLVGRAPGESVTATVRTEERTLGSVTIDVEVGTYEVG